MGYTHYFRMRSDLDQNIWNLFIKDVKEIIKMAEKDGISIVDGMGNPGTEPKIDSDFVILNGEQDEEYESLWISRKDSDRRQSHHKEEYVFGFCKTQYRPYDPVVVSILSSLKRYFPENVLISSDGEDDVFKTCKYKIKRKKL
jgi:hypothetical protein